AVLWLSTSQWHRQLQAARAFVGDHDATRSPSDCGLRIWRQLSRSAAAKWSGPARAGHSTDGVWRPKQSGGLEALLRSGLCLLHESPGLPESRRRVRAGIEGAECASVLASAGSADG